MTTTESAALEAMLSHHAALAAGVTRRVEALRSAVREGGDHEAARAGLLAYAAGEVLPHAEAEEHSIYRAAAAREGTAEMIAGMVDEHHRLGASLERLAAATDGEVAAAEAEAFGRLFAGHVAEENSRVLPPLAADRSVDLAGLLAEMHRLVRTVTAEPVALLERPAAGSGSDRTLDVRGLAPAARHDEIFAAYSALAPGTAFVLVNDHDPKPLRYQFEAEHAGAFTWEPIEAGAEVWRVRIGRPSPPAGGDGGAGPAVGAGAEVDVRRLPHGRRHDVIFAAFDALDRDGWFLLVNDHDPRPLRYQFEAQHPGGYSWEYPQAGPEVWRVRIGRPAAQR